MVSTHLKCHTVQVKSSYHHGDLRGALLEEGERALRDGGAEVFSLRDLSRALGVSSQAPRRHFPSKQALLDEIALSGFKRLRVALDQAITDDGSFEIRLLRMSLAYVHFATENRALMRLMFSSKHNKDASALLKEANLLAWSAGPRTVEEGQKAGQVIDGDPALLAMLIFASVEGVLSLYTDQLFGLTLNEVTQKIVKSAIRGLKR